jgi:hypothetical protein
VCWICGDEHDAGLTARLLASAVDTIEQAISMRMPDYLERWAQLLLLFGMHQRADDLEDAVARHKEHVLRLKAAGLGHAQTWLERPPAG